MVQRVLRWERQKKGYYSRKRQGPMAKKYSYDDLLLFYLGGGREDEDNRRQNNGYTWFLFSDCH